MPGDKSLSHRAIIMATLAAGTSTITGLSPGKDVWATMRVAEQLGAKIEQPEQELGRCCYITGLGEQGLIEPTDVLDFGNSGTGARLWMGAIAGYPIKAFFTGDASLRQRPMDRALDPLRTMGASFNARRNRFLPLVIDGKKPLKAIKYAIPVPSAQVKSAILLAGLAAKGETFIKGMSGTRVHTEHMLVNFGAKVEGRLIGERQEEIRLIGPTTLRAASLLPIHGDLSSAAFAIVANLLSGDYFLSIPNVLYNPFRSEFFRILQEMGANLGLDEKSDCLRMFEVLDIRAAPARLRGVEVPAWCAPSMIDEYPILAVAAACAEGTTTMHGLSELRYKESDRLTTTYQGLKACGVGVEVRGDSLIVHGCAGRVPGGCVVKTNSDHRIAMSFLVLGMAAHEPIAIDDGSFIDTSFPGFIEFMNGLGADIRPVDIPPEK